MKFLLKVTVETYWNYVVEAADENEARSRAVVDYMNSVDDLRPDIEITQVPDDTPEGDA